MVEINSCGAEFWSQSNPKDIYYKCRTAQIVFKRPHTAHSASGFTLAYHPGRIGRTNVNQHSVHYELCSADIMLLSDITFGQSITTRSPPSTPSSSRERSHQLSRSPLENIEKRRPSIDMKTRLLF